MPLENRDLSVYFVRPTNYKGKPMQGALFDAKQAIHDGLSEEGAGLIADCLQIAVRPNKS